MSRGRLGAAALLTALLAAGGASAAERPLALEVVMNGRATGRVGEFLDRDGVLYALPSELRELGFALPSDIAAGAEPIPLSSLPNVRAQVNEARQTLIVEAGDAALQPTELGGGPSVSLAPMSPGGYGALLNYDLLGAFTGRRSTGGALLDVRAFSPYGVVQSTELADTAPASGQKSFVRLDTTYTYAEPNELRRWRAGDVVTGTLSWSRAVRLGGGQVASDFGLRPDLVTYPLPVISAAAAVPSTVDVLVDGIRQFSGPVEPGPFAVRTLPVVTGAGEVAVTVQDALGRQTLITLPFYASAALLKPGLASYSLEAGAVRQNYGLSTNRYTGWAGSGSARYGLTDRVTLESHGEATNGLVLLGGGGALQLGTLGILSAAVSGSSGRGGGGGLISGGFQRISPRLSLSVSGTFSTAGYRDIAAVNGSPAPQSALTASLAYQLGRWGDIGVAYVNQTSRAPPAGPPFGRLDRSAITTPQVQLVNASYSVSIGAASVYATGFKDLRRGSSYGLGIGVSFALGRSTSASVGGSLDSGRASSSVGIAKTALAPNDYGYRLQDSEGAATSRSAEAEFLGSWGRLYGGVDQSSGQITGRAGARGALVLVGRDLFASDQIHDSFAVVRTGGVADVPVLYENRPMGVTDSRGRLLVPSLLSYQNNQLTVDASRLPADIDVGQTSILVRPPDRSGVVVDFRIRKVSAALLRLQDINGQAVPLGSVAKVQGAEDRPVGYDGEAYVTGLRPTNRIEVVLPNGTRCAVQFDYRPVKGDIPVIGPLRCQ
jgi:outer membrane usher protein